MRTIEGRVPIAPRAAAHHSGHTARHLHPHFRRAPVCPGDAGQVPAVRAELKREIAAHAESILPAVLFAATGRAIRRVVRAKRDIPWWCSALALGVAILLALVALVVLMGEGLRLNEVGWTATLSVELGFLATFLAYPLVRQLLLGIRDHVADAMESASDLADLQQWAAEAWATRRVLAASLCFAALYTAFALVSLKRLPANIPAVGAAVGAFTFGFFMGIGIYYLVWALRLPPRLSRYHFRLFGIDPVHSPIVDRLSILLTQTAYGVAFLSACGTLLAASSSILAWATVAVILTGWLPASALFIGTQLALAKIVRQAKRQTMNRLQAEIGALTTKEAIAGKDTRDALNGLLALYDRVKGTPTSAVNLRAILNLLNQLLLPVFGSLLGLLPKSQEVLNWLQAILQGVLQVMPK